MNKFIYGVLLFTLVVVVAIFLLPTSWNGKKITDVLSTISALIAPIVGVMSAYAMFDLSNKKERDDEEAYHKDMLSLLLIYTVTQTEKLTSNIIIRTLVGSTSDYRRVYLPDELKNVDQGYVLVGKALNIREFDYPQKQYEVRDLIEQSNLSRLVYCDDWYEYLKSIKDYKVRKIIVDWLLTLRSENIKSYDLITNRDKIISTLRKSNWVKSDISNLSSSFELCNIYIEESKEFGLNYDIVFTQ